MLWPGRRPEQASRSAADRESAAPCRCRSECRRGRVCRRARPASMMRRLPDMPRCSSAVPLVRFRTAGIWRGASASESPVPRDCFELLRDRPAKPAVTDRNLLNSLVFHPGRNAARLVSTSGSSGILDGYGRFLTGCHYNGCAQSIAQADRTGGLAVARNREPVPGATFWLRYSRNRWR